MRLLAVILAACLVLNFPVQARMGDGLERSLARYGQPVGSSGKPNELTSTRTFQKDGILIVCGYVANKVEMISFTNRARPFVPSEVEGLLRSNGQHINWTPSTGFGSGTYHRADGTIGTVTDNKVEIKSPKWNDALARDEAAEKAAAKEATEESGTSTNGANPNYTPELDTNAASHEDSAAETNVAPEGTAGSTTNAAP